MHLGLMLRRFPMWVSQVNLILIVRPQRVNRHEIREEIQGNKRAPTGEYELEKGMELRW